MSKFCTACGKEIPNGVTFCTECGAKASEKGMVPAPVGQPAEGVSPEGTAPNAPVCKSCGAVMKEGVMFCTECGAPRNSTSTSEPSKAAPIPPSQPAHTPPPQPAYQQSALAAAPESKVVGTGTYFGLQLLFALPVIGWIVCLAMAFASKNRNIRNYARATLIWIMIGIVLSVVFYFVGRWIFEAANAYMSQSGIGDIGKLLTGLGGIGD